MDTDKLITELENSLIGELNLPEPDKNGLTWMNEELVDAYKGLKISIKSDEHPPAHFHVKCQKINASFSIEDCNKIAGELAPNELKNLKRWYSNNKQKLIDVWNRTRPSDCTVGEYR
jgi:hypothetical protein